MDQLAESDRRFAAAGNARHFAVHVDGTPISSTDLYSDGRVAQIEDVGTLPDHRGAGHASAVVMKALEEARAMGHEFIFLVADARDWPKEMYRRLGFDGVGEKYSFLLHPLPELHERRAALRHSSANFTARASARLTRGARRTRRSSRGKASIRPRRCLSSSRGPTGARSPRSSRSPSLITRRLWRTGSPTAGRSTSSPSSTGAPSAPRACGPRTSSGQTEVDTGSWLGQSLPATGDRDRNACRGARACLPGAGSTGGDLRIRVRERILQARVREARLPDRGDEHDRPARRARPEVRPEDRARGLADADRSRDRGRRALSRALRR